MITRFARGLFAALLVAALIAVPVLAIRSANPASEQLPAQAGDTETLGEQDEERKGPPWAKEGDGPPFGNAWGHGRANDDDESSDSDDDGNGPPWAKDGDGPPFGNAWGHGRGNDNNELDDADKEGKGPPWAKDGDGPPFGNAWGYWLNKGGDEACERMTARMQDHPGDGPPVDLRDRITSELGCDLPE